MDIPHWLTEREKGKSQSLRVWEFEWMCGWMMKMLLMDEDVDDVDGWCWSWC